MIGLLLLIATLVIVFKIISNPKFFPGGERGKKIASKTARVVANGYVSSRERRQSGHRK